jgi:DNA-binding transcriptional ArsR family regulator
VITEITKKKTESKDFVQPLSDIDKMIHEPARLMIMSYLYVVESADFVFLRNQTGLTDGNLSSHLSKLESAGYVVIEKKFKGKKPQTMLKLSAEGREAFGLYRKKMEQVLGGLSDK